MFEDLYEELKSKEFLTDKKEIINNLKILLKSSISQDKHIGIAFSGGVDSCLLALLSKNSTLYSVGLKGSDDLNYAKKAADQMNWNIKVKEPSLEEAEGVIKKVVDIMHKNKVDCNVVNIGVGCVVYSVLEMAKEDNVNIILGGLGSEEIFAGYERHTNYSKDFSPETIQSNLWLGLKNMEIRDLSRDLAIAEYFRINLIAPFLNKDLVKYAMQIHPSLKINKSDKKIILRETAFELGLPKEFAFRKKKAAQYGSKFDRALLRLANKNGFKYKKDYINHLQK